MKRFLLFAGDNYYPCGGTYDLIGDFDTQEEAEAATGVCDWAHILDTATGQTIVLK